MDCVQLEAYLIAKMNEMQASDSTPSHHDFAADVERLNRNNIECYQLLCLEKSLAHAYQHSSFYRAALDKQGIKPDFVKSLQDLAKLPFTEPADVSHNPFAFACVSEANIKRAITFISSGTTGPQKRVFFTERDLERITDFMAAGMSTVASPGDVIQILLPAGPVNSQADLLAKGVRKMGGVPIITGMAATAVQIETIKQHHSKVLFGFTSSIYRMTLEAEAQHDLDKLGVKTVFLSSEYLSSTMRENMRRIWQAEVVTHYGLTEMGLGVAVECHEGGGYHFNEADLILEIIDPETGRSSTDSQEGEMVFTTLNREAMPLFRYRTHDIARMIDEPCRCGAGNLHKFSAVTRRRENVVNIGSYRIYPALLDEALFLLRSVVDWRAELIRDASGERLCVQVEQSPAAQIEEGDVREALLKVDAIRQALQKGTLSAIDIGILPSGGLLRSTRTKKLIADSR